MSLIPVQEFHSVVRSLEDRLRKTAAEFVNEHGLGQFEPLGLSQMSHSLRDVALELLTLGGDVWPIGTNDEEEVIAPLRRSDDIVEVALVCYCCGN